MPSPELDFARWLLDAGCGRSAVCALGALRGAEANRIRALAGAARPRPGVYALAVTSDNEGLVVPLDATPGIPRAANAAFRGACARALELGRERLGARRLPSLRFELEEWLGAHGASVGLPALLATLAHYAPQRKPMQPVLATGELLPGGRIGAVGALGEKLRAANAELGERGGLVMTPDTVRTMDEAIEQVFGCERLELDPRLGSLDETLQQSRTDLDHDAAIRLLESAASAELPVADQARLGFEIAMHLRHRGDTEAAREAHTRALELLGGEQHVLGAEAAERYSLSYWSTALDEFRLEEAIAALRDRLLRPFLVLRNEVRCRGTLAQALGMAGRFDEAVAVRRENLPLQEAESWLRDVLPGTYVYLAQDSAHLGDGAAFDRYLHECFAATRSGDENQWRYNATAAVRGLVLLGREHEALEFAAGRAPIAGAHAPTWLGERSPVETHPEVSALRALCRGQRRAGNPRLALAVADRVGRGRPGLVAWLCELVRLEAALAHGSLGDRRAEQRALLEARQALAAAHAGATRHHAPLLDAESEELERAIDRVWY